MPKRTERTKRNQQKREDLSWLSLGESFWHEVIDYAKEARMTTETFLVKSVRTFIEIIREHGSPDELSDAELANHMAEAHRRLAKKWWDKLTPQERKARAKKAAEARWNKPKDNTGK